MIKINEIIEICQNYKTGKLDIIAFQQRIEHVQLPDVCKKTLEKDQHNVVNELEFIYYYYPENMHKEYADKIADYFINASIEEKNRLTALGYR